MTDAEMDPREQAIAAADEPEEAATPPNDVAAHDEPARPRSVVQISRPLFWTVAIVGALTILALATATTVLALANRRGDDPVVATVNGEKIRRSEYDRAVAPNNGEEVLDGLMVEYLVVGEGKKRNIAVGDDETAKLLDEQRQNFGSDQAFQAALARAGLTEQDLTKQLRLTAMLRRMVADKAQVTDDEVAREYAASQSQFPGQTLDQVKEEVRAELQQQKENAAARALLDQLRSEAKIETRLPGKPSA